MSSQSEIFNWEEIIKISETLYKTQQSSFNPLKDCSHEAIYRTICSRAYYGIFKQIEDFLKENSVELKDTIEITNEKGETEERKLGSHEKVIIYLQDKNSELYKLIERLRAKRHQADYKAKPKVKERDAEEAYKKAKRAHELFLQSKDMLL